MEALFASYVSLLRRHGLSWVIETKPKTAVAHVLSAVRPLNLQDLLQSDLEFAKSDCKKYFKEFLKHDIKLAKAFKLLENGPKKDRNRGQHKKEKRSGGSNRNKLGSEHVCHELQWR